MEHGQEVLTQGATYYYPLIETGVREPHKQGHYVEYRAVIQGHEIVVRIRELANGVLEISNAFVQTLPRR